jgi:outer membrane protein
MKKTILMVIAMLCFATVTTYAQGKYGHINSQEVMRMMPGADSLQFKLEMFQQTLQNEYQTMVEEFNSKQKAFDETAGTMTPSVRKSKENDLVALKNRIMEFQEDVQSDLEEYQFTLVKPLQDKLQKAIDEVAKEKGYTYIFDTQILLYSGGEDITPLVKAKLGIK